MKLILCALFMMIAAKDCDNNQAQVSNDTSSEANAVESEIKKQDQSKITYQATSRGFFMNIRIEGDLIIVSDDHSLKTFETYPFPMEEKEVFLKLLNEINTTEIPELEPPSKAFQVDGAAMAWLEISDDEGTYKTAIFDHGKPPRVIQKMVEKILSLKTMVEKQ